MGDWSKKEANLSFFHVKLKKLREEFDKNNNISLIGGYKDTFPNPMLDKLIILLAIFPIVIFASLLVYLIRNVVWNTAALYVCCLIIVFIGFPLIRYVYNRKHKKTISDITLKRDVLEIRLLDKHSKTKTDAIPILYKLNEIAIKYSIYSATSEDGSPAPHSHYIYIKDLNGSTEYYIPLLNWQDEDFKAFIVFINLLIQNIYVDRL